MTSRRPPRRLDTLDEVASLRAQVRALRAALSNVPGTIIGLYSLDGVCRILVGTSNVNITAQEGMHYTEFLPEERRERFLWLFERAKLGMTTRCDYPMGLIMGDATTLPIYDPKGAVESVLFYVRDVTAERAVAAALVAREGRDSLTGLARRSVLQAYVDGLVQRGREFHVLFMDLDGFKSVNDSMGHKTGDLVLERVAHALRESTRAGDLAVRLGGDEFVVVLADTTTPADVADRLLRRVLAVTEPFGAGASVGLASYPEHGVTLDDLLAAADVAMYRAKVSGGGVIERPA